MNDETFNARRRALAEALKNGENVVVSPSGEVQTHEEAQSNGFNGIKVPEGKLA